MNRLMIFKTPDLAQKMREAGFAVLKQQYNGKDCFAVEETAELMEFLTRHKQLFAEEKFAFAHTLNF